MPIDYTVSKIRFVENTIITKKIEKKVGLNSPGNFFGLRNFWKFDDVMNSDWQKSALDNHEKLTVVISRFLHAKDVYDSSKFLIYYSIIEYLKGLDKEIKTEFSLIEKKEKNTKCNEAINILIELVPKEEIEEFKIKLDSIKGDLKYRYMRHPLEEFLSKNNIQLKNCSINIKKLIAIRNSLIHGSSKVINYDEIEKANILLYRITGILILKLIGINEYKLDLNID